MKFSYQQLDISRAHANHPIILILFYSSLGILFGTQWGINGCLFSMDCFLQRFCVEAFGFQLSVCTGSLSKLPQKWLLFLIHWNCFFYFGGAAGIAVTGYCKIRAYWLIIIGSSFGIAGQALCILISTKIDLSLCITLLFGGRFIAGIGMGILSIHFPLQCAKMKIYEWSQHSIGCIQGSILFGLVLTGFLSWILSEFNQGWCYVCLIPIIAGMMVIVLTLRIKKLFRFDFSVNSCPNQATIFESIDSFQIDNDHKIISQVEHKGGESESKSKSLKNNLSVPLSPQQPMFLRKEQSINLGKNHIVGAILIQFLQHFNGFIVVINFGGILLKGIAFQSPSLSLLFLQLVCLFSVLIAIFLRLTDRLGVWQLLMIGSSVLTLTMMGIAIMSDLYCDRGFAENSPHICGEGAVGSYIFLFCVLFTVSYSMSWYLSSNWLFSIMTLHSKTVITRRLCSQFNIVYWITNGIASYIIQLIPLLGFSSVFYFLTLICFTTLAFVNCGNWLFTNMNQGLDHCSSDSFDLTVDTNFIYDSTESQSKSVNKSIAKSLGQSIDFSYEMKRVIENWQGNGREKEKYGTSLARWSSVSTSTVQCIPSSPPFRSPAFRTIPSSMSHD